jgi:hypothetical protein
LLPEFREVIKRDIAFAKKRNRWQIFSVNTDFVSKIFAGRAEFKRLQTIKKDGKRRTLSKKNRPLKGAIVFESFFNPDYLL